MISVSASLFQNSFTHSGRETAFQAQVKTNSFTNPGQLVHNGLQQGLKEHMGVDLPAESRVNEHSQVFDVDAVVTTVMEHVAKRIEQAAAKGATDEELASMMDAARAGVEKGFKQAFEQIDAAGQSDDELTEKINSAEQGIYEGLDELQEALLVSELTNKSANKSVDEPAHEPESMVSQVSQYEHSFSRQKNNFAFELITQEGDKVTIQAMNQSSSMAMSYMEESADHSLSYYESQESSRSGYAFNVEGDLNEAEMTAIEDLMAQVNNLADEFYDGDLGTAFNMAMDLSSDKDQISQFSLNLRQSQVSSYQYSKVSEYEQADALPQGLMKPLGHFAQGLQDAVKFAQPFKYPQDLVQNMFEQMEPEAGFKSLLQPMFDALKAA